MLYLIGLGLNEAGFSFEAYNAIKNSRKVYLETYTVELPYDKEDLEKLIEKKVKPADREFVEADGEKNELIIEAKQGNVALLIYGSPLMATTHISLIQEAKKNKVPVRIIQAASVIDAVAETGLQLYKFGKISSIAKPQDNFNPTSFIQIIKDNEKINAHTLILVDIGLSFKDALKQLEDSCKKEKVNADKIVICEQLGTKNSRIYYNSINKLKSLKVNAPFCFILPSKELHFLEKEMLEGFKD